MQDAVDQTAQHAQETGDRSPNRQRSRRKTSRYGLHGRCRVPPEKLLGRLWSGKRRKRRGLYSGGGGGNVEDLSSEEEYTNEEVNTMRTIKE